MTPFELYIQDPESANAPLPPALQSIYSGGWHIPERSSRPYTYSNLVLSRDGRVSFNLPTAFGGGEISDFNAHDTWLMGLLRARADAIMIGDGTLKLERKHIFTHQFISPEYHPPMSEWRASLGMPPKALQVVVSLSGEDLEGCAAFGSEQQAVIAITTQGYAKASEWVRNCDNVQLLELGRDGVDLRRLAEILYTDFAVKTLLCEGGPGTLGQMHKAGLIDDEFLTFSPVMVGQNTAEGLRPGLIEGVAFTPETAPRSRLLSLRRAGNHLFLRSRYENTL